MTRAPDRLLEDAATLYRERHAVYGDSDQTFAAVMKALCGTRPMILETEEEWRQFGVFVQIVSKLVRYVHCEEGPASRDSLSDLAVYAMMLRAIEEEGP